MVRCRSGTAALELRRDEREASRPLEDGRPSALGVAPAGERPARLEVDRIEVAVPPGEPGAGRRGEAAVPVVVVERGELRGERSDRFDAPSLRRTTAR